MRSVSGMNVVCVIYAHERALLFLHDTLLCKTAARTLADGERGRDSSPRCPHSGSQRAEQHAVTGLLFRLHTLDTMFWQTGEP